MPSAEIADHVLPRAPGRSSSRVSEMVSPAAAGAQERSPLEAPDPVQQVRIHVAGAVELAELESAGFDLNHGVTRVPTGLEVDTVVTHKRLIELVARGAKVVEPGQEFKWSGVKKAAFAGPQTATVLPRPPDPTVRIVRADYFTTKGQPFLYVEARTTQGAQTNPTVGMTV